MIVELTRITKEELELIVHALTDMAAAANGQGSQGLSERVTDLALKLIAARST